MLGRLRVVLMAEGRGVSFQLLGWNSKKRQTTVQDGPGPNKRCPYRIKMPKGNGQIERARHILLSLLQLLAGGENPASLAHPEERPWES